MITRVGKIDQQDLPRLRLITARENARKLNPRHWSGQEIVEDEMKFFQFIGEMIEKYGIDATREYAFSPYTGDIWYND